MSDQSSNTPQDSQDNDPGTAGSPAQPNDPQNPDQSGAASEPTKSSAFDRFKSFFGLGAKEEEDIIDLAQRRQQKRKKARSGAAPHITEKTPIEEIAIHADMTVGDLVSFLSKTQSSDEDVISSFDEENEHPAGAAIHHIWTTFFYIVPPTAALAIGLAIGWQFGGEAFTFNSIAIMTMCVLFEAIPILLMLATAKLIGQAMAGVRKAIMGALIVGLVFGAVAIGSSIAQWVLFEGHINYNNFIQVAGAAIRTLSLPLAEIAAALALPILHKKSLDAHLAVLKKKNDAKIAMNRQRVSNQVDLLNAAITTKSTLQKEQDYQKKQDLANKLIDMVTEKIIRDAEKSLSDTPSPNGSTGYGSRRDTYR